MPGPFAATRLTLLPCLLMVGFGPQDGCPLLQMALERPPISGEMELSDADLLLVGTQRDGQAGLAVALAGDINGDGFDDVLVGAPGEAVGGVLAAGAAHLIYGSKDGVEGVLDLSEAGAHFTGYVDQGYVGRSVSAPGDVNGDGFDDVLVGSGSANEAYLFYGPVYGTVSCADADVRFVGAVAGDRAGSSVAGVGDVNGDRFPDLAIGAPTADSGGALDRGAVYLVWGGERLLSTVNLVSAPVILWGSQAGEQAGTAIAGVGDLDEDGDVDLAVGAPFHSLSLGSKEGAVYVLKGPILPGVRDLSTAQVTLLGEVSGDNAGSHVSAAGDVDWDQRDDLLIGARKNDAAGTDAGAAYLWYGADLAVTGQVRLVGASAKFFGEAAGDGAGFVARGGDVNGDGYSDLVIGASSHDNNGAADTGAAYVIYGPVVESAVDLRYAQARIYGVAAFDQAGYGVGGGGDVNADDFHDIIVGAVAGDGPLVDVGTAGLFLGGN